MIEEGHEYETKGDQGTGGVLAQGAEDIPATDTVVELMSNKLIVS